MKLNQNPLLEASPFSSDCGELIGRDPKTISPEDWSSAGTSFRTGLKAIRAMCLSCCHNSIEVRKCRCTDCPLWPLRLGAVPKGFRASAEGRFPSHEVDFPQERSFEGAHTGETLFEAEGAE